MYVLLTDGQQADNLEKAWAEARKPAGAKLIIWDVVGWRTRISNRPDIVYLRGYSSSMMDVVRRIMRMVQPDRPDSRVHSKLLQHGYVARAGAIYMGHSRDTQGLCNPTRCISWS